MKVDSSTRWDDFSMYDRYVKPGDRERLMLAAVSAKYGDDGFYGMPLTSFLAGMKGDFTPMFESGGDTVFDLYRTVAFAAWIDDVVQVIERLSLKPTARESQLSAGCIPMAFDESVYVFCRSYFGLGDFQSVSSLTVADYLLAKKDDFNRRVIDRNSMKQ